MTGDTIPAKVLSIEVPALTDSFGEVFQVHPKKSMEHLRISWISRGRKPKIKQAWHFETGRMWNHIFKFLQPCFFGWMRRCANNLRHQVMTKNCTCHVFQLRWAIKTWWHKFEDGLARCLEKSSLTWTKGPKVLFLFIFLVLWCRLKWFMKCLGLVLVNRRLGGTHEMCVFGLGSWIVIYVGVSHLLFNTIIPKMHNGYTLES